MSKSFVPILVLIFTLVFQPGKAQDKNLYDGLSLKLNVGGSSLHGDITKSPYGSISDLKLGFSITGIKKFNPIFGIQVRYYSSYLSIKRPELDEQLTGEVSEIGLAARIEPLNAIGPNGPRKIYPYARIGISSVSFRALHWYTSTSVVIPPTFGYKLDNLTKGPKENALSFPMAIGFGYKITDKISFEFEQSISGTNTDYVDATSPEDSKFNDFIGFTNIGIRYNFGGPPLKRSKTSTRSSNKTRRPVKSTTSRTAIQNIINEDFNDIEEIDIVDPFDHTIPVTKVIVESLVPKEVFSGKIFEVILKVHKNDYKGPATISINLPTGFTALETPLRHAQLKLNGSVANISWRQMPVDSIVSLRFHIHVADNIRGLQTIYGNIRYSQPGGSEIAVFENNVYVDNSIEALMDEKFLRMIGEDKNPSENYSRSVTIIDPLRIQREEDLNQKIDRLIGQFGKETTEVQTDKWATGSTSVSFIHGIEYRIQCGAFRTQGEQYDIIRKYNIKDPLREEFHNGYYKYTTGSLKTFKEAERWRDDFIRRTNLHSVFIVAYKNGVRLDHISQVK